MKKKALLKTGIVAVTVVASLAPAASVWAGIEEAGQIVDGSELTLFDFVEDEDVTLTRGSHLARGSVALNDQGNRVVGLGGQTDCHVDCDTIYCNIYLEQKDSNGIWNNIGSWKYTKYDSYYLHVSRTKKVEADHWYRAKGSHIAILNNAIESCVTVTDGIWID